MNTIALQSTVKRVLVEKRAGFDLEAQSLKKDLIESLHIDTIENIRVLNRYDVEDLSEDVFENAAKTIFSEANLDVVYYNKLENINVNTTIINNGFNILHNIPRIEFLYFNLISFFTNSHNSSSSFAESSAISLPSEIAFSSIFLNRFTNLSDAFVSAISGVTFK